MVKIHPLSQLRDIRYFGLHLFRLNNFEQHLGFLYFDLMSYLSVDGQTLNHHHGMCNEACGCAQEEIEQSRRQWARERAELTGALGEADARARDLADQLEVLRAALPPDNPHHHFQDGESPHILLRYIKRYLHDNLALQISSSGFVSLNGITLRADHPIVLFLAN